MAVCCCVVSLTRSTVTVQVKGWKVGESVYSNGRWMPPTKKIGIWGAPFRYISLPMHEECCTLMAGGCRPPRRPASWVRLADAYSIRPLLEGATNLFCKGTAGCHVPSRWSYWCSGGFCFLTECCSAPAAHPRLWFRDSLVCC